MFVIFPHLGIKRTFSGLIHTSVVIRRYICIKNAMYFVHLKLGKWFMIYFLFFLKDFRPVRVNESTETSGKTLKKNAKQSSAPWSCTQAEFPAAEPTLPARWRRNTPDSPLIAYFAGAEATLAAAACCCMTPCCNTSRWKCYQIPPAPAPSVTAAGGRKLGKSPWLFLNCQLATASAGCAHFAFTQAENAQPSGLNTEP